MKIHLVCCVVRLKYWQTFGLRHHSIPFCCRLKKEWIFFAAWKKCTAMLNTDRLLILLVMLPWKCSRGWLSVHWKSFIKCFICVRNTGFTFESYNTPFVLWYKIYGSGLSNLQINVKFAKKKFPESKWISPDCNFKLHSTVGKSSHQPIKHFLEILNIHDTLYFSWK